MIESKPFVGRLGLDTDEGRSKLRKAQGRRMQPLNLRLLNETSYTSVYPQKRIGTWRIETS